MPPAPPTARPNRRAVLRGIGALGLLTALPACASRYAGLRLTIATGNTQGVYYTLGSALATAWHAALGTTAAPVVRSTAGSVDNLQLLASGGADVAFSQIDTAADAVAAAAPDDPRRPAALARIYDDVVHVVVPAGSSLETVVQLRGMRVSIGAPDSGVNVVARRVLRAVGVSPDTDLQASHLGLEESAAALRAGRIDAFFWSGGLPTRGVSELASTTPIRLLDLQDVLAPLRATYPVYTPGTVPAGSYGMTQPVTTLLVRNVLLVRAELPDDVAHALVAALFARQNQIAQASPAALTIDLRAAIGTQPVPLHPGAERWYREERDA